MTSKAVRAALTVAICIFTPLSTQGQQNAPLPDSALAALISGALFDSLRSGGSRVDMMWIAGDSVTLAALAAVAAARGVSLAAPRERMVICPGSTDSSRAPHPAPAGYHVFLRTRADSGGRLVAQVSVRCQFVFRGRDPRGFGEGMSWEVAKESQGWRLIKLHGRWIT